VLRAIEWILLGSASTAAIIAGAWWRRPSRFLPWALLAASIACMGIGDVFYAFKLGGTAEYFYLAMFVMVAAALVQFTRGGSLLVDRARLIDLLAWACATLLVVWVFIVRTTHELGKISAADVIGDLLLATVALRLVMAAGRNPSAKLLLSGAVGMLISDVIYPLAPGPVTETGYIVLYVTWGIAALHPSMTGLTQPMPPRPTPCSGRWAALLGASVATPPLVLLYEAVSGPIHDGVVIAVAGAITLTLAITRLADSVSLSTRAADRERGLRIASAALVAAVDPPAVDEAVRSAVAQLLPSAAVREIVFAADDRRLLAEGLPVTSGPADRSGHRSWWRQDPPGDEATLVCPLWLEPLAVARPGGGALVLTGRRDDLAMARDALEVLAGQAALALDRISRVDAVGRRDSDLYLRAVVHNTADMMLVTDDDQRIRYASPALRTLLGEDELPPLATLTDLVHPDDRGQVRRALLSEGDGTVFCALRRADHSQVYVELTYRDLRADRLVQGYVVTLRNVTKIHNPIDQVPHLDHIDELPAWVNRRSAQHKFRY
jgi:PAS domain S-box-containing protein